MMVGHALLAFALVAGALSLAGYDRERALSVGLVAGGFAAAPDADMAYALVGFLGADYGSVFAVTESFWATSTVVHRSVTHSLVVAVPAALAFAGWTADVREFRAAGAALALALVVAAYWVTGPLAAVVMAAFVAAGLLVASVADAYGDLGPRAVLGAALVGLWSHPWGDLVTGEPPRVLYPLSDGVLVERVALSADPTLHLLGAFGLELAAIWLAAVVYCRLSERSLPGYVRRRAAVGAGYGVAVLLIDPPTLAVSYHFVFSILAVGVAVAAPYRWPRSPLSRLRRDDWITGSDDIRTSLHPAAWPASTDDALAASLTGLAGLTAALVAYALAYGLLA
ncbi:hydrolase [Halostella sp. JP-L12]|uniref:metal-dependent hydrolase n=1 Tax=Halostella TaxID=1843185 RepID=UPI000EF76F1D|nr:MULTISPECIES: metal-dependent hydrolase [Halostella]NHN48593.1 hydrolase [Halostella sp. JP-L12]